MSKIKHVSFLNPHGNFDQNDSYLTEHPDFKNQLVYVKKLSMALAEMGIKVDIITRQINDPEWPEFNDLYDSYPDYDNLRIIRLPFGGDKFLAREKLWPHLKEYVDSIAEFYDEEGAFPDFFSTHHGDGGMAGVLLKEKMETPFSFTAHSLGAVKMDKLNFSQDNFEQLVDKFKFHSQIIGERLTMKFANQIIVNSSQEKIEQYSHPYYRGAVNTANDEKFSVIPPGVNDNDKELKTKNTWSQTAEQYLKAMEKGLSFEIPVIHSKIPAYYFLPDSDNEHKLLEEFKEKVFKK